MPKDFDDTASVVSAQWTLAVAVNTAARVKSLKYAKKTGFHFYPLIIDGILFQKLSKIARLV
jgi:hypothetical protein